MILFLFELYCRGPIIPIKLDPMTAIQPQFFAVADNSALLFVRTSLALSGELDELAADTTERALFEFDPAFDSADIVTTALGAPGSEPNNIAESALSEAAGDAIYSSEPGSFLSLSV